MTDRLVHIEYIESDIPDALTLRDYGRALARERRAAARPAVSIRFRALAVTSLHRTPRGVAA